MLSLSAVVTMARPEPPRGQFPIPQSPPLRQQLPRQNYGPPPTPSDNYGEFWENRIHQSTAFFCCPFRLTATTANFLIRSTWLVLRTTKQTITNDHEKCLRSSATWWCRGRSIAASSWSSTATKTLQIDLHQSSRAVQANRTNNSSSAARRTQNSR